MCLCSLRSELVISRRKGRLKHWSGRLAVEEDSRRKRGGRTLPTQLWRMLASQRSCRQVPLFSPSSRKAPEIGPKGGAAILYPRRASPKSSAKSLCVSISAVRLLQHRYYRSRIITVEDLPCCFQGGACTWFAELTRKCRESLGLLESCCGEG